MLKKLSSLCAKKMILLGNIHSAKEAVLQYGCELIISSVSGILILLILSMLFKHPLAWLFFLLGFAPHRTVAGGYHADTHIQCCLVMSAIFSLSIVSLDYFIWNRYSYLAVSFFSAIAVITLAPVATINKPLSKRRYLVNRKRSFVVISINVVFAVICSILNMICEEATLYYSAVFFATVSLIMGKIKYTSKGEKNNES